MDRSVECRRLAEQIGWVPVYTGEGLSELGISDPVRGEIVWLFPEYYKANGHGQKWVRSLDFDPWENANDDLRILELMKGMTPYIWGDYKDCLYHETKGHGTHNVWDYKKGKFANAAIMLADKMGWR